MLGCNAYIFCTYNGGIPREEEGKERDSPSAIAMKTFCKQRVIARERRKRRKMVYCLWRKRNTYTHYCYYSVHAYSEARSPLKLSKARLRVNTHRAEAAPFPSSLCSLTQKQAQYIQLCWRPCSFCLLRSGLQSPHTGENKAAF